MGPISGALFLLLLTLLLPAHALPQTGVAAGVRKRGRLRFSRLEHEPRIYAAAPSGVPVAQIRAFDVDDASITPFYRLLGENVPDGDAEYFQIHAESGNLTTKRYIDRPRGSEYKIMVGAYSGGETEYIDITVCVTEYNMYSPLFQSQNYKVDVELVASVGIEITTIKAVDKDPQPYNSEVYYYVQSRVVAVNRTSGVVTLRENLHPRDRSHSLSLLAFDGGSPRRKARSILSISVKFIAAPRDVTVDQTGDQWAMLCWTPPPSGSPLGYVVYLTAKTDFMSSVSTQRNVSREELGSRAGRNCTALADLESWSDFEARVAGWDSSEVGMISRPVTFDTKVNHCPENACENGDCIVTRDPTVMYRCKCEAGYYGLRCDMFDPCYFGPCRNNGTCYNLNNSQYKCSCLAGFYGDDCSQFNPCSSTVNPCQHGGTCSSPGSDQWECWCPPGYQGQGCEMFNPCAQTACQNGGSCLHRPDDTFGCVCPPGYTGTACELDVDECASTPCKNHGRCVEQRDGYQCICAPGYDGPTCEVDVDDCQSNPCQHGASCIDLVGGYGCYCAARYTGAACEVEISECSSGPCFNNGTCVEDAPGFTCICTAGFEGDRCEVEAGECGARPCLNGGTCEATQPHTFRCLCTAGFAGHRCQLRTDLCAELPCQNGGKCVEQRDGRPSRPICRCQPGYNGSFCQQKERCPAEMMKTKKGNFMWPEVEFNTTQHLECPFGAVAGAYPQDARRTVNSSRMQHRLSGVPVAERSCVLVGGDAVWLPPLDHTCRPQGFSVAEELSIRLKELTKSPELINASVFLEASGQLRKILNYAITDRKIAQSMVQVVSSILDINSSVLWQADGDGAASRALVDTINSYTSRAKLTSSGLTLSTPNIQIGVRMVDKTSGSSKTGVKFLSSDSDDEHTRNVRSFHKQVTIEVPHEAIELAGQGRVRVQFVLYRNGKLFRGRGRGRAISEVPVISATLSNVSVNNLNSPVRYTLSFNSTPATMPICVYWDPLGIRWLTDGVRLTDGEGVQDQSAACEARHMTAFSVLLDPQPGRSHSLSHQPVLSAISYVGALLSITGLMLTLLTYSIFRSLNRDRSGKILLNLCVALLLTNMSFLVVSVKEQLHAGDASFACTAVALLAHYSVLCSLAWMLVEALNMYQLLITVFASSETRFMLKRMILAWGVPLCVVAGTVQYTGIKHYRSPEPDWCLFSPSSMTVYYVTFLGPASFILLVNTGVFLMVGRVMCQRQSISKNIRRNNDRITAAQVRGAITVMTLLGVTWVLGVFAVGELRLVFQYLFSVANSLQGFIIFIVRCVQYPEARRAWGRFVTGGLQASHTSSSSQTRATGALKVEMARGGLRTRSSQDKMRELRTEIVRTQNSVLHYTASTTLPRPSGGLERQPVSRTHSLRLDHSAVSKEGEDTSWRFLAASAPPAPTDQGYGTAEHSPESPRQQQRRGLSVSTPERLHAGEEDAVEVCSRSEGGAGIPKRYLVTSGHLDPRDSDDATSTAPASPSSSSSLASPSPSASTSPTPSCCDTLTHPPMLRCEQLL